MSSANALKLDWSKIMLFGKELIVEVLCLLQSLVHAVAKTQSIHAQQVIKTGNGGEVGFFPFLTFFF